MGTDNYSHLTEELENPHFFPLVISEERGVSCFPHEGHCCQQKTGETVGWEVFAGQCWEKPLLI